jgi:undecaprenyl-diphosphatase
MAVTLYSVFIKTWDSGQKGYKMILADSQHIMMFALGNVIAFVVAVLAIKLFIGLIKQYGFTIWGWYRIVVGIILLVYFYTIA